MIIECDINLLKLTKSVSYYYLNNRVLWGEREPDQIEEYNRICNNKLKDIDFLDSLRECCDGMCENCDHFKMIDALYFNLLSILSTAAVMTYKHSKHGRRRCIAGWNTYVAEAQLWD